MASAGLGRNTQPFCSDAVKGQEQNTRAALCCVCQAETRPEAWHVVPDLEKDPELPVGVGGEGLQLVSFCEGHEEGCEV